VIGPRRRVATRFEDPTRPCGARRESCLSRTIVASPTRLERALGVLTEVHPGEAPTALLLALDVFLILMAYYVLKPVREALILGEGSAELKSYMSAAQVAVLAFVVPYYGRLVSRYVRIRLINIVTTFFIACLVVFYLLAQIHVPLAIVFFLWIGIFNLMIVAQFWSFANDVYTKEEGERLFAIVGLGASLGAVVGARIADRLIEPIGVYPLMLIGAILLFVQLLVTNHIDRRERARTEARGRAPSTTSHATASGNVFGIVFRTRYLLLMALMLTLLNVVNTTGEYILGSIVKHTADGMVASGQSHGLAEGQLIADFYSKYFTAVNVLGLLLQLFVVSRVVKYLGVSWAVLILPILSLQAYGVIALYPALMAVLTAKVLENSTDYSLNNTVRNMLFLPCTYEQKFSAKQAIDSFFWRMGDVLSALLVFVGTTIVALAPRGFAAANAVLVLAWLLLAWRVGQEYARLAKTGQAPSTREASRPAALVRPATLVLAAILGTALLADAKVRIQTKKDDSFKFQGVRTWAWHPDGAGEVKMAVTPDDDPAAVRARVEPIIKDAVTRALTARGLTAAAGASPDLYVVYYVLISTNTNRQTIGANLSADVAWQIPSFMQSTQNFEIYEQGSLVLDVSGAANRTLVWRGVAQARLDRERQGREREARLREAIDDLIKKFPKT
jgi:ATP:ADP antiporter, AAA family